MEPKYYGMVDTLCEFLCENDTAFRTLYNLKLKNQLNSFFKMGAIKCVKKENIPVQIHQYVPYCDLYKNWALGLATIFYNQPNFIWEYTKKEFFEKQRE